MWILDFGYSSPWVGIYFALNKTEMSEYNPYCKMSDHAHKDSRPLQNMTFFTKVSECSSASSRKNINPGDVKWSNYFIVIPVTEICGRFKNIFS